jgi:hypothetical protein
MWETSFKPTQKNTWSYILRTFIFTILKAQEKTKNFDLNNSRSLRSDTPFWKLKSMGIYFSSVGAVRQTVGCVVQFKFQIPTRHTGQNIDATVTARAWVLQLPMREWTLCGCLHERLNTAWVPPSLPLDAMALKLHCSLLSVLTEGALYDCYETDIMNE